MVRRRRNESEKPPPAWQPSPSGSGSGSGVYDRGFGVRDDRYGWLYDRWFRVRDGFGFRGSWIGEDEVEGTRGRVGVADEGVCLEGLDLGAAQQEADGLADIGFVARVNDEQEASVGLDGYWLGVVVADTGEDFPTNESGEVEG